MSWQYPALQHKEYDRPRVHWFRTRVDKQGRSLWASQRRRLDSKFKVSEDRMNEIRNLIEQMPEDEMEDLMLKLQGD